MAFHGLANIDDVFYGVVCLELKIPPCIQSSRYVHIPSFFFSFFFFSLFSLTLSPLLAWQHKGRAHANFFGYSFARCAGTSQNTIRDTQPPLLVLRIKILNKTGRKIVQDFKVIILHIKFQMTSYQPLCVGARL